MTTQIMIILFKSGVGSTLK